AADGGADGAALELGAGGDDWAAAGPGDHRAVDRRAAEREVTAGANRAHGIGGVVTGGVRGATGTAEAGRERP
ncbi:MAG: hypothetical protein LBD77_04110, partial [Bifidobacteriaceae bacterium]|nr:hypothetical protein [Bifidobacteriaceae bacterium]